MTVEPSPRVGNNAGNSDPRVAMINTQYEVLPAHADAQNPNAELKPT